MNEHFLFGTYKSPKPKNKKEGIVNKKPEYSAKPKPKKIKRSTEENAHKLMDKIYRYAMEKNREKYGGDLEKAYKESKKRNTKVEFVKEGILLGEFKKRNIPPKKHIADKRIVHHDGRKPFGKQNTNRREN